MPLLKTKLWKHSAILSADLRARAVMCVCVYVLDLFSVRSSSKHVSSCVMHTFSRARTRVCTYVCVCARVCKYVCLRAGGGGGGGGGERGRAF